MYENKECVSDMMFILLMTCEYNVVKAGKVPGKLDLILESIQYTSNYSTRAMISKVSPNL
jgi:hypothetical protein